MHERRTVNIMSMTHVMSTYLLLLLVKNVLTHSVTFCRKIYRFIPQKKISSYAYKYYSNDYFRLDKQTNAETKHYKKQIHIQNLCIHLCYMGSLSYD